MRREFLKKLLALAVVPPVVDELKIPLGKSFISLYTPSRTVLTYSQVVALELERVNSFIPILFDRDDTFYSLITKDKNLVR